MLYCIEAGMRVEHASMACCLAAIPAIMMIPAPEAAKRAFC